MRIGVLGGAFDPPHAAHAALAAAARAQLNLDRVIWVPTFSPPHKGGPNASFADRVAMTRALAAGDPASEVSEVEATLPPPSYTLQTLRALKKIHGPGHDWHLILGADNLAIFPRWHEPEAVLAEASLAVYPRGGFPEASAEAGALPHGAVMLNFPEMPEQSTEFREALHSGPSDSSGREAALARLPRPVAALVRELGLYRTLLTALAFFALFAAGARPAAAQSAPIDSVSPVFRSDSLNNAKVKEIEAGKAKNDSVERVRGDSLVIKLRKRGPYVGLFAGVSFTDNSAKELFSEYMDVTARADSQRIVQPQSPVHVVFPGGLVVGVPVSEHFDLWLRTEHFWYRVAGLAQKNTEPPAEFWYQLQGHLLGAGARYLVPISFLAVNGEPGLYAAYTHFWSVGPTGLRAPTGSLRAQTDPAGAGYEIQVGLQQDFARRFTWSGGLAYSKLAFASDANWRSILGTAPDERAEWTLRSMRFMVQGMYQFGK